MIRVTGPTGAWSCGDKILSLPSALGVMDPRKVFLTSKPTPRSLSYLVISTARKSWNFFPWKIMNLAASSLSLEERFRLQSAHSSSNIDDRSPACIISFLQVVRKAWCQCPGVLRAQPLSRFLLSLAWCRVVDLLVDFHPNPTHTLRLKDLGGAPPYWLGAAQLKAGGSCPMRCDDLSHCRKLPLASRSAPIEQET